MTNQLSAEERAERLEERLRIAAQDRADARMRAERLEKALIEIEEEAGRIGQGAKIQGMARASLSEQE